MIVLRIRELNYAMSASRVSSTSHSIGIVTSAADCLRSPSEENSHSAQTVSAEEATSEASVRSDFDHNATPMWVFNTSTLAFSAVNDAAVHHYGYSRDEFLSMTILDIGPSEDVIPLLREILHRGIHRSAKELRKHKKKDGSLIEVEVTRCEVLFNGRIADMMTAVECDFLRSSRDKNGTVVSHYYPLIDPAPSSK